MIEEKNATMAEATPVLEDSPVLDETPALDERPVQTEELTQEEAPVLDETSAQEEAPVLEETSVAGATPTETTSSAVQTQSESSEEEEKPIVRMLTVGQEVTGDEAPVLEETSVAGATPVETTPSAAETQSESSEEEEKPVVRMLTVGQEVTGDEAPVLEETSVAGATPVETTPSAAQARSRSSEEEDKPVVRILAVGQEVTGIVKRVSEFGAFVDIGVGRDGLVHISELSARRVAKVTDVLQQGQEATFWIKKLDRDRNRISLTMIEPGTKTIRNMDKGDIVQGTVTRIMPYGAFVDIGIGRDALLHVREMGERFVAKPEDVVQVGELIDARILDISRRRARVDLSIKGLRPEPEPEPMPEPERKAAPEPEPESADPFEDMEVLSPIEAALRKAMKESGTKLNLRKDNDRRPKKNESARARALQEDILARTLNTSGKK